MKKKFLAATIALIAGCSFAVSAMAAENPADQAGIQHNMYLGCLMDLDTPPDDALTVLVKKCGYDPGMPLERFIATQQPVLDAIDPARSMAENLAGVRQQFSPYEFSFIERMDQIVQDTNDVGVAALRFEELEHEAIERLDPRSKNGALILGGLSVARHSTRYWSQYAAINGQSTAKQFPWKMLLVIAADALGYIITQNTSVSAAASNMVQGWLD